MRIKKLEVKECMQIYVIYVTGTRMIRQGTGYLSPGCLSGGILQGDRINVFVPLRLTVLDSNISVLEWLESR